MDNDFSLHRLRGESHPESLKRSTTMKNVSVMCFHDELCQVFNALMTALSLLRECSKVTVFFGSRGINAVHRERFKTLTCLPDEPPEVGKAKRMDKLDLPLLEDMFVML